MTGAELINRYNAGERDFSKATLNGADLSWAKLERAKLSGAYLGWADLRWANLSKADLCETYLFGANLCGANLCGANLSGAKLSGANLTKATLTNTCLDPTNKPNGNVKGFKTYTTRAGNVWVVGYRSRNAIVIDPAFVYQKGKTYNAPVFSTSDTDCHPGLYLKPYKKDGDIEVRSLAANVHKAGYKWRTKQFRVME